MASSKAQTPVYPAHAGEPHGVTRTRSLPRVYPRPRGGAVIDRDLSVMIEGLSPPTRGSQGIIPQPALSLGSIPAHAGSRGGGN